MPMTCYYKTALATHVFMGLLLFWHPGILRQRDGVDWSVYLMSDPTQYAWALYY